MSELSPAAERTRRAILEAGIEVLAANHGASISEIASKAGVSRSTFHRYFCDKTAFREAAHRLAVDEWTAAIHRARLPEGTGFDAYRRLCTELLDNVSALVWWMSAAGTEGAPENFEEQDETDHLIAEALRRGHRDGTIDSQLSVEWISNSVWAVLYAVCYIPAEVTGRITSFEARQQALRTLLKAAATDPSQL